MKLGYFLSSEECGPHDLVRLAKRAEDAGFHALWISDHYHPWNDEQGHSPFVWSAIGAIAQATERMRVTTAVTCPTVRIHPAVLAQAAATCSLLLDGRFQLGIGSGEALNEHILGDAWPETDRASVSSRSSPACRSACMARPWRRRPAGARRSRGSAACRTRRD